MLPTSKGKLHIVNLKPQPAVCKQDDRNVLWRRARCMDCTASHTARGTVQGKASFRRNCAAEDFSCYPRCSIYTTVSVHKVSFQEAGSLIEGHVIRASSCRRRSWHQRSKKSRASSREASFGRPWWISNASKWGHWRSKGHWGGKGCPECNRDPPQKATAR